MAAETPTATGSVRCVVVTPERALLDEVCEFIALPMYDGELGVLPGRLPLIGRLGFGELRTQTGGRIRRYYIDGGFVQIRGDVVTVLTSKALKAEDINITAAETAISKAQVATGDPAAQESALRGQARARAQVRIAKKAAEQPSLTLEGV